MKLQDDFFLNGKFGTKIKFPFLLLVLTLVVSGCMYPQEQKRQHQPADEQQMEQVQNSVDAFQQETGVLPILTTEADTPLYQKYALDFNTLTPRYLPEPPANSFEAGGIYRYVLVDVEQDPTVKLIDLRLSRAVQELQFRLNEYVRSQSVHLPVDQNLGGGYFTLDHERLNLDQPPQVTSPFSGQSLPLIMDQNGQVGIDYRIDVNQLLEIVDKGQVEDGADIRPLLVENGKFVPVHSFPYRLENGEPVFIESWNTQN